MEVRKLKKYHSLLIFLSISRSEHFTDDGKEKLPGVSLKGPEVYRRHNIVIWRKETFSRSHSV